MFSGGIEKECIRNKLNKKRLCSTPQATDQLIVQNVNVHAQYIYISQIREGIYNPSIFIIYNKLATKILKHIHNVSNIKCSLLSG